MNLNEKISVLDDILTKLIKSIRIYKNGRFDVEFAKKSYAEEIAKQLIDMVGRR